MNKLPNNIEAEQAVLGSVIIDQELQTDILSMLNVEDFYMETHRNIFHAMQIIFSKNIPIDFVTLTSELEIEKQLEAIGGIDYITFLSNIVPSAANYKHYCNIVLSNSMRRKIIKCSRSIINDAMENGDDKSSMQFAEKCIFDLSQKQQNSDLEPIGKPGGILTEVLKEINKACENKGKIRGISTGFAGFDKITNGLQKSDLILLAARPGVGKTSFAMNIASNAALKEGKKVAIFDLEMSKLQLIQRTISSVAKVNLSKVLGGELNQEEWKRIWTAERVLAESYIYLDDSPMTTPMDIISKCRKLKMTEGLDLIVIDYLQLMKASTKTDIGNRVQEISEITRMLKVAAKELDVPIILLSQLSRLVEQREDHRPILSDLRESGSIEQDADIVLFLYNPENYNDVITTDEPGTVHLIIAKHRNGSTGEVKLKWVKEITTFENLA